MKIAKPIAAEIREPIIIARRAAATVADEAYDKSAIKKETVNPMPAKAPIPDKLRDDIDLSNLKGVKRFETLEKVIMPNGLPISNPKTIANINTGI